MNRPDRGTALVGVGALLLVVTLLGSALLAPGIATGSPGTQTLVGSQGGGTGWHEYGSVYLLNDSREVWKTETADSYFDVTRLSNGSILAGFMDGGYEDCGPYDSPCVRTGFRILEPGPEPTVTGEYSFPVRSASNSEVHAASLLPSGEYLVGDMDRERVFTVRNGEITWQWNASSFYDPPRDPTRTDWLHLNDVDRIGDGRYMVSIRNANQILILERGQGVVEVINADRNDADDGNCMQSGQLRDTDGDGDIRCGDPDVLNHQHNPQWLGDGAVLVADSHNDRVVELHRTAGGVWKPTWVVDSAEGVAFDWPRDADRLPTNSTLITDTLNRRLLEINETGYVVWSVETPLIPYEADRIPYGEPVGAPLAGGNVTVTGPADSGIPILSLLLVGIKAVFPGVPYWFNETQLGLTLASVGLMLAGSVLSYRDRTGPLLFGRRRT
jgi:hypothetical protein